MVVCKPPASIRPCQFFIKALLAPRSMSRSRICKRLELAYAFEIIDRHRAELQVNIGKYVIDTGQRNGCGLFETKALAFGFFRIG